MAVGEVRRCPRERPGPGPDAVRMASVAIGDVAAESRMKGSGEDPELLGGGASEVVTEVLPFAVDLLVAMMGVAWVPMSVEVDADNTVDLLSLSPLLTFLLSGTKGGTLLKTWGSISQRPSTVILP